MNALELREKGRAIYMKHMSSMAREFSYTFDFTDMDIFLECFEEPAIRSALQYQYARVRCERIKEALPR